MMQLTKDGKVLKPGDSVETVRGEIKVLRVLCPPKYVGSSGRIQFEGDLGTFFPGVIGAKFCAVAEATAPKLDAKMKAAGERDEEQA